MRLHALSTRLLFRTRNRYEQISTTTYMGDPRDVGRRVVLPASSTGSHRNMHCRAIARKLYHPDLLIAFTCNPAWPEFQSASSTFDRHQMVARVSTCIVRLSVPLLQTDRSSKQVKTGKHIRETAESDSRKSKRRQWELERASSENKKQQQTAKKQRSASHPTTCGL